MIEQKSCCVLALPGVTEIELGAYFCSGLRSCLHASGDDPPLAVIDQVMVNCAYGSICPFPTDSDSSIR